MLNIIETNLVFDVMNTRKETNRLILHNSGVKVRQVIEVIHNYHKNTLNWAGIGYHFYIRRDGSIYRGRPENMVGAHAGGNNSDSIGICFEGDFNQETMTEAQIKAGQELVAYLKEKYGISKVQRHSDVCNTSCPGANFPFDEIVGQNHSTSSQDVQNTKSIVDLANEVIAGKYGVGEARKQALGSLYNEVQAKVNEILLEKKSTVSKKSNETIAEEVIAGKWGNGADRKARLKNAGYDYNTIQKIVNKKLK